MTEEDKVEKLLQCEKCKKEISESQGHYVLGGSAFCCKECCGDPEKGEHEEKVDNVCEFC